MLFIILTFTQILYIFNVNKISVKEYERISLNIPEIEYTLTKSDIKALVSDLYKTPHIYIETDKISPDQNGNSNIIFRTIRIKKNLSTVDYAVTYAHELTHIKYQVADETFTTYMAFITLYESGNVELQNMALKDAQGIINGGYAGTEYDCGFYILEYLKDKGEII